MKAKGPDHLGRDARLNEDHSQLMATVAYGTELDEYAGLWRWLSIADIAHVRSLEACAVIDQATSIALQRGLLEVHAETPPRLDPHLGDLYNNRDVLLRERLGEMSDHIHTGRARREATTLAWHLETREQIELAVAAMARLLSALVSTAETHSETLMPDFTYLQHAHPTTLGHYLLGFAFPLARDIDRLNEALSRVNRSPAASGSVNGTRFGLDRRAVASDLDFDGVLVHTRDAMWAPDLAIDPVSAALSAFVSLDRLSEELIIWSSSEFGFFEAADQHSRTSVIMPQKKNPYGLAMIRGQSRDALGDLVSIVTTNMTPTGQPDNRIFAYQAVPSTLKRLRGCADLLAEHLDLGRFDVDRLRQESNKGFASSTEICDWMTLEHGISNRSAHAVVGLAVRHALARGGQTLVPDDLDHASTELGIAVPEITAEQLVQLQDPTLVLAERKGVGSTADLTHMISQLRSRLDDIPTPRFDGFERRFLAHVRDRLQKEAPIDS